VTVESAFDKMRLATRKRERSNGKVMNNVFNLLVYTARRKDEKKNGLIQ
jgi:hypothetical protein